MPAVSWGAILQGEPTGLDDWVYVLKQGFDPWVEVHAGETILRSASLDALKSADEVRARAEVIIERLNGAVALSQGADPVRFHGVVEFAPDGGRRRIFFGEVHARARSKARAEGIAIGPDGQPIPTPPQPTEVQSWAEIAENDPLLEDAIIYFGRATNWFDIYKTVECLEIRFGGDKNREAAFLALKWAPKRKITRLKTKTTANWPRHAKRKYDPPKNPMDIREARSLLAQLLRRALLEAQKPRQ